MARKHQSMAYDLTYIAICVAFITVCSWIAIPFFVNFTLQTFAIFFISAISGWKKSLSAILTYLALGAIGIPVFSGFQSGISALFQVTGGYLWGFIGSALIVSGMVSHFGHKKRFLILSMLLGLLFCYATGTIWYVVLYVRNYGEISLWTALGYCCLPFLIPDLVKIILASFLTLRIYPRISR
ncbi:MAG: biotin transporter BioY [Clostridia bacterium]|nr:biotin transporter BioY [Clostridia bacterium]